MKRKCKLRLLSGLAAIALLAGTAQAVVPTVGAAAENLISNSTFDTGTTDWAIYKESGGAATLSTDDGRLALNITNVGTLNYAVQLYYDIIPLYQNGVYRVSFEISADTPRYVEFMIQENGGKYTAYTWKGLPIDEIPTKMDYTFVMEDESDIMTKLCFNCGLQKVDGELGAHTVYLDNVVVELIDDSEVDYSSIGPYQPPILTNQVGFRINDKKTAVVREDGGDEFAVHDAETDEVVFTGTLGDPIENTSANETDRIADFSDLADEGTYYITCGDLDASYPFVIAQNPYSELMNSAIRMFYLQRCGTEVVDDTFGHKACHDSYATLYGTNETVYITGGWHDAGDYGRYTVAGAKAVADLMYAYLVNPDLFTDSVGIPESGNGIPDILDETRYELEWMLQMQAPDGGVYHKITCATFPGYVMPEMETKPLIVTPVSSTATADFCASMALAAEVYDAVDPKFAEDCRQAANRAWKYLEEHPDFNFKNPSDISTGDYGDKSDADERYWAACQMARMNNSTEGYLDGSTTIKTGLDWATVGDYGNIALVSFGYGPKPPFTLEGDTSMLPNAWAAMKKQADSFEKIVNSSPYGSPITKYAWGSNMTIANAGIMLAYGINEASELSKYDAANEVLNYLLGKNPLGTCFVTGFGTVSPEAPHHRPSMAMGEAQPGMLVGGVNSAKEDSAAKAYCAGAPAAKCYVDNAESYSTNEITIYWNSPLIYLLALTETISENMTSEIPPSSNVKLGDTDESGIVDVSDAVLLARYTLSDPDVTISAQGLLNADVNGDGKHDSDDVILIVNHIAGIIEEF